MGLYLKALTVITAYVIPKKLRAVISTLLSIWKILSFFQIDTHARFRLISCNLRFFQIDEGNSAFNFQGASRLLFFVFFPDTCRNF